MKTKTTKNRVIKSQPSVRVNPTLDRFENVVLFPKKLKAANEILRKTKLPHSEG
jgi:hypothetical protein